jgi:hypothetical protein
MGPAPFCTVNGNPDGRRVPRYDVGDEEKQRCLVMRRSRR